MLLVVAAAAAAWLTLPYRPMAIVAAHASAATSTAARLLFPRSRGLICLHWLHNLVVAIRVGVVPHTSRGRHHSVTEAIHVAADAPSSACRHLGTNVAGIGVMMTAQLSSECCCASHTAPSSRLLCHSAGMTNFKWEFSNWRWQRSMKGQSRAWTELLCCLHAHVKARAHSLLLSSLPSLSLKKRSSCLFPRAYCFVIKFWDFVKKYFITTVTIYSVSVFKFQ
jgi:hypothetical protein